MRAEFWNKTVLGFWTVQEQLLGTRTEEQDVGPKATAIMSGVFLVFVYIFLLLSKEFRNLGIFAP